MNGCFRSLRRIPCSSIRLVSPVFHVAPVRVRKFSTAPAFRANVFPVEDVEQRLGELDIAADQLYPRIGSHREAISCHTFVEQYEKLGKGESRLQEDVVIHGRAGSIRSAGPKLFFVDVTQGKHRVQGLCNLRNLKHDAINVEGFKRFYHLIRKGDTLRLRGTPHRTDRGELSISMTCLPQLLSPCLHRLPVHLQDHGTRRRHRHVDLIMHPDSADIIRIRSEVSNYIRRFLLDDLHVEVQTPILAEVAGGAIARPFRTSALEFPERQIALRTAPELWLKQLIVGGLDRVFEIGPCFRNEGIDSTHNPEFTTCEFYRAYTDIEELMSLTETMLSGLAKHIANMPRHKPIILQPGFIPPFKRIDFIPAIEDAIGSSLPELTAPNAQSEVARLLIDKGVALPTIPTLPRLLDKLSAVYIEPHCFEPTFIINHPETLSPLSKSFRHSGTGQIVSARAELFVKHQEIVNTYEEENSPFEQRRKFTEQLAYRDEGDPTSIDENYLRALEWGLPPTGGWGAGIDRLCMLMSGSKRIGDVLPFGTLREVVALGRLS